MAFISRKGPNSIWRPMRQFFIFMVAVYIYSGAHPELGGGESGDRRPPTPTPSRFLRLCRFATDRPLDEPAMRLATRFITPFSETMSVLK